MEILNIQNLSVSFDGKPILSDFSLSVSKGDKILIKGQSGIGKSTLFRMIMGFGTENSGTILFDTVPVDSVSIWDLRKKIAYVSQDTDIAEGKVSDLIDEVFSFRENRNKLDRTLLEDYMFSLSLSMDILSKDYTRLSGGEKQRISLILALLSGKDLFLLDEVTAELDVSLKKKVVSIFFENPKWTVLSISHDIEWENKAMKVIDFPGGSN